MRDKIHNVNKYLRAYVLQTSDLRIRNCDKSAYGCGRWYLFPVTMLLESQKSVLIFGFATQRKFIPLIPF